MRKALLFFALICACAPAALAQDYHRFELFGGYSHARVDTGIGDSDPDLSDVIDEREGFHGFNVSATGNLNRYFGLKFDFSGHFKSKSFPFNNGRVDIDSSIYNVLGGVQIKDNSTETRFKPFAHALAGIAKARNEVEFIDACPILAPLPCPVDFTDSDTGFAAALGGGLDIRAGSRFDIRAIQIDYNPTKVFDNTQHNFRIGVGIVIH